MKNQGMFLFALMSTLLSMSPLLVAATSNDEPPIKMAVYFPGEANLLTTEDGRPANSLQPTLLTFGNIGRILGSKAETLEIIEVMQSHYLFNPDITQEKPALVYRRAGLTPAFAPGQIVKLTGFDVTNFTFGASLALRPRWDYVVKICRKRPFSPRDPSTGCAGELLASSTHVVHVNRPTDAPFDPSYLNAFNLTELEGGGINLIGTFAVGMSPSYAASNAFAYRGQFLYVPGTDYGLVPIETTDATYGSGGVVGHVPDVVLPDSCRNVVVVIAVFGNVFSATIPRSD